MIALLGGIAGAFAQNESTKNDTKYYLRNNTRPGLAAEITVYYKASKDGASNIRFSLDATVSINSNDGYNYKGSVYGSEVEGLIPLIKSLKASSPTVKFNVTYAGFHQGNKTYAITGSNSLNTYLSDGFIFNSEPIKVKKVTDWSLSITDVEQFIISDVSFDMKAEELIKKHLKKIDNEEKYQRLLSLANEVSISVDAKEKLETAKNLYKEALKLKPGAEYPLAQIELIEQELKKRGNNNSAGQNKSESEEETKKTDQSTQVIDYKAQARGGLISDYNKVRQMQLTRPANFDSYVKQTITKAENFIASYGYDPYVNQMISELRSLTAEAQLGNIGMALAMASTKIELDFTATFNSFKKLPDTSGTIYKPTFVTTEYQSAALKFVFDPDEKVHWFFGFGYSWLSPPEYKVIYNMHLPNGPSIINGSVPKDSSFLYVGAIHSFLFNAGMQGAIAIDKATTESNNLLDFTWEVGAGMNIPIGLPYFKETMMSNDIELPISGKYDAFFPDIIVNAKIDLGLDLYLGQVVGIGFHTGANNFFFNSKPREGRFNYDSIDYTYTAEPYKFRKFLPYACFRLNFRMPQKN